MVRAFIETCKNNGPMITWFWTDLYSSPTSDSWEWKELIQEAKVKAKKDGKQLPKNFTLRITNQE